MRWQTVADEFFGLSAKERREVLGVAAGASGRPLHLLDKDTWLVWTLHALFRSSFAGHLVFKGGSSLSKAYHLIRRFSEDVDLTYDIRALAPDLVGSSKEALPPNRSQEKRWSKEIRAHLPLWIGEQVVPELQRALDKDRLPARLTRENDKVFIEYEPIATGSGYTRPAVLLEFGARSTGEPWEVKPIRCDASEFVSGVRFPTATARVMLPERTFWEKATAVHVYCLQGEFRGGERFARHWHDLTRLNRAGIAELAIANRGLARAVARHKSVFFAEKDSSGSQIDYEAAVSGGLRLVPTGIALKDLMIDYAQMVEDGLLSEDPEPFKQLIDECEALERRANNK